MRTLDWAVVGLYFLFMLVVGLYFMRRASRSLADYFVSGRDLPWWVMLCPQLLLTQNAGSWPGRQCYDQGGLMGNAVWWDSYVRLDAARAVLWSSIGAVSAL